MPPWPKQVSAQPRAAAEHLPEFGFRPHDFEKDEVDDLRHINAGVEHVDRDRDVRRLVRLIKIIEQRLRVFGLVVDRPCKRAFKMRVVDIETLNDELRMFAILGENNRLAEPIAGGHLEPVRH